MKVANIIVLYLLLALCLSTASAQPQVTQRPVAGEHPLEQLRFLLGQWTCQEFVQTDSDLDQLYSSTVSYRLLPGDKWIGSEEVITGSRYDFSPGWYKSEFIALTTERLRNGQWLDDPSVPMAWYSTPGSEGIAGWLNGVFTLQLPDGPRTSLKIESSNAIEWNTPATQIKSHGMTGGTIGSIQRCKR